MNEESAILQAIQDLRSDVIAELQSQRQLWGEAEATLLAQGKLHRERLDRLDAEVEELRTMHEAADEDCKEQIATLRRKYHELNNKLTPVYSRLEALEKPDG